MLASGYSVFTADGTWPANPGNTGFIPSDLILVSILCCKDSCMLYQAGYGKGPPHPLKLPILSLKKEQACHEAVDQNL